MPEPNLHNEKELLLRVSSGDQSAFGELMRAYHTGIYYAAYRLSGDQWMAEEVVQDIFLKVWLNRSSLSEINNFSAWLITIAGNMTLNAIKQSLRKKNDVKSWAADFYKEVHDSEPQHSYLTDILQQALQRLSPRQREAYSLIKEQGYQRHEAATKMNVSPETVKTHLEQALRIIRAYCISRINPSLVFILFAAVKNYF